MIQNVQIITIEKAEYIEKYTIRLTFNDATVQTIDLASFILDSHNPHIAKYADQALFQSFRITDGDLEWNDYDLCFPIEDLYENKNLGSGKYKRNEAA